MSEELETRIRALVEVDKLDEAATLGLERYGTPVFRFLVSILRDPADAEEVFAIVSEKVWRNLSSFEWRSSFKTWMFVLARNAAYQHVRDRNRERARVTTDSKARQIAARVRTQTEPYLKTGVKERFAQIRAQLSDDERSLLALRVDQSMSWDEIAAVLFEARPTDADRKRASARARQRYATLKRKLRALAEADGLLNDETA